MKINISYKNDLSDILINIPENTMYASVMTEIIKDINDEPIELSPTGSIILEIVFKEDGQQNIQNRTLMYSLYRALINKEDVSNLIIYADNEEEIFNLQEFKLYITQINMIDTALVDQQIEEMINMRQNISIQINLDWQV